jgi:AraC-like DNA-binding protein
MSYREIVPHPALREHVDRFWVHLPAPSSVAEPSSTQEPSRAQEPRHILPDGCIDVLVVLPRRSISVVGTMTRALVIDVLPLPTAAVRFRPGAATAFLGVAAHELTESRVATSELALPWLDPRVLDAHDPLAAVALLQQGLLRRQAALSASQRLVAQVVRACFGAVPPTVKALAQECGYSRQRLTRVVLEEVGIGAKELVRVGRLQRAVVALQARPGTSLAQAALDVGYFDQAHMCRDFRGLVGLSPSVVRAAAGTIFPIHSLLAGA